MGSGNSTPTNEEIAKANELLNGLAELGGNIGDLGKNTIATLDYLVRNHISYAAAKKALSQKFGSADAYTGAAMHRIAKRGGFEGANEAAFAGGCGCGGGIRIGGMDMYGGSDAHAVKEGVVKEVLAMARADGAQLSGSTPEEQLASYLTSLKDPSAPNAAERCKKLAARINELYGDVIDTSLPTVELCAAVVEVLSSFRTGMHSEFLTVYSDVRAVLHNLMTLDAWLDGYVDELGSTIADSNLPAGNKAAGQAALIKDLSREIKRQITMLGGLMQAGNLETTAASLARAAARSGDLSGAIERLRKTSDPKSLSVLELNMRRGVALNAIMARHIQKALEMIGVSIAEFKAADTLPKLREAMLSGLLKKGTDSVDAISAAQSIIKLFDERDQIIKLLETGKTGSGEMYGGAPADEFDADFGRYDENGYPKSDIARRQDAQDGLRDMVLSVFTRAVNDRFNAFVAALNALSSRVGKEVNPGESLRDFTELIGRIRDNLLHRKYVYYALIGYYNDAMSKSVKDEFVGNLRMLVRSIDGMLALPENASGAQYFRDVKDSLNGVISIIDKYSEEISAKFGSAEHAPKSGGSDFTSMSPSSVQTWPLFTTLFNPAVLMGMAGKIVGGSDDAGRNVGDRIDGGDEDEDPMKTGGIYGGDEAAKSGGIYGGYDVNPDFYGGAHPAQTIQYQPSKGIMDALTAFTYNARAALIRKNLEAVAQDTSAYGKDQTELNANSIVEVLQKEQKKHTALREHLSSLTATDAPDAERKAALAMLDEQWRARRGFWSVVESMDQCMRNFTDSMLSNPTSVKDIDTILSDIEVIADWPGKNAGNVLAEIFEKFPTGLPAPGAGLGASGITDLGTDHYYDALTGKTAVGNPFIAQAPVQGQAAYEKARMLLMRMTALKNLFSVFIHFGRAVGSGSVAGMMSPANMYRGIVDYLRASAFTQGFRAGLAEAAVDTDGKITAAFTGAAGACYVNVPTPAGVAAVGVANAPVASADDKFRRKYGIRMRGVAAEMIATEVMGFELEDKYFVHMIKAAAAKILTVTGTYALFSRPAGLDSGGLRIAPIRMILGGGIETPEVIPDATALYLRLPLLVHWYRRLFDGEEPDFSSYPDIPLSKGNTDRLKISFVPDIDGTFAPLIRLIFRELRAVDTAAYTDEDVRKIVREINLIYQREAPKHTGNVIRGTINDLVNEINRRYGIVAESDYNLQFERNARGYEYSDISGKYGQEMDEPEIAILPDEDKDLPQRLTPSQRLLTDRIGLAGSTKARPSRFALTDQHREIVKSFRCAIDKLLEGDGSVYQFSKSIDSVANELKTLTGADKRIEAVARLMRGSDLRSRVDGMKYVMFNETVVASLNVLSGIHTMLKRFQTRMVLCDFHRIAKLVAANQRALAPAVPAVNTAALVTAVWNSFKTQCTWIEPSAENEDILKRVFGWDGANYPGIGGVDRHAALAPLLAGIADAEKLYAAARAPTGRSADWEKANAYFRGIFDHQWVMRELVESVSAIADGVNASASISDGHLVVSYGGIEESVRNLFASALYFLNLLRSSVEETLIARWTDKLSPGSFYWLQEQLLEKILIGRDPRNPGASASEYVSLEKVSRGIAGTWDKLIGEAKEPAGGGAIAAAATRVSYADLFSGVVYYDANLPNSGLMGSNAAPNGAVPAQLQEHRTNPYEELVIGGPPDKRQFDTRFAARFKQLYTWGKEFTHNRSLLFDFNQIVASYLRSFYDINTRKIYTGLIDKFANGAFAQAVNDPINYTYPDCVPAIQVKFGAPANVPIGQSQAMSAVFDRVHLEQLSDIIRGALVSKPTDYLATRRMKGRVTVAYDGSNVLLIIRDMADWVKANVGGFALTLAANGELHDVATGAVPAPGVPAVGEEYVRAFNAAMTGAPATANPALAAYEAFESALAANPFGGNMGDTGSSDRTGRVELLATIVLWQKKRQTQTGYGGKTLESLLVESLKNGTYNIPMEGRPGALKFIITGDDIVTMADTDPAATSVSAGSADKSTLLYARSNQIAGSGIAGSTYEGLGGKTPEADTVAPNGLGEARVFGQRADPDADHVLFASLAVTLRTLMSTKVAGATSGHYLCDNIADLPHHMKERYRANLPAFKKLIAELVRRCEFFKSILSRGVVDASRATKNVSIGGALAAPRNPWPHTLVARATESGKNKSRFTGIIDAITRGCAVLMQSIDQAMREVGDDAKYLETYTGSIRDYAAQNGVAPFAPLSSVLALMKNGTTYGDEALHLFPTHSFGEPEFKLMFATRGLLAGDAKQTLENVPALNDIVQQYNAVVGAQNSVDNTNAALYLERFVAAVRWLHSTKNVRGLLTSYHQDVYAGGAIHPDNEGVFTRHNLIRTTPLPAAGAAAPGAAHRGQIDVSLQLADDKLPKAVRSIDKDIEDTIRLSESSMREEKIEDIVDYLYKRDKSTMADIVVQNVLDLDIVPINVHALMREIPFASLLNYSYTFDRMIIELFYGRAAAGSEKNVKKIIQELCSAPDPSRIRSAKDMLVALLIDPYMKLDAGVMPHLAGMLRGTVPLDGLARPRFLADELYGKAVFGEVYCEPEFYNEMGTGAGHARSQQRLLDNQIALVSAIVATALFKQRDGTAANPITIVKGDVTRMKLNPLTGTIARFMVINKGVTYTSAATKLADLIKGNALKFNGIVNGAAAADIDKIALIAAWLTKAAIDWIKAGGDDAAWTVIAIPPDVVAAGLTGLVNIQAKTGIRDNFNVNYAGVPSVRADSSDLNGHDPRVLHYLKNGDADDGEGYGATIQPDNASIIDNRQVRTVELTNGILAISLPLQGAIRFDTVLSRNLVFIVNLLRTMRLQLTRDVFYGTGSVRKAKSNIAPGMTEIYGNNLTNY